MKNQAVRQVVIGLVIAVVAWIVAFAVLAVLTDPQEVAVRSAFDWVTLVVGYITLFAGIGTWLVKAMETTGGLARMTAQESATPAALTIVGALLLAT